MQQLQHQAEVQERQRQHEEMLAQQQATAQAQVEPGENKISLDVIKEKSEFAEYAVTLDSELVRLGTETARRRGQRQGHGREQRQQGGQQQEQIAHKGLHSQSRTSVDKLATQRVRFVFYDDKSGLPSDPS